MGEVRMYRIEKVLNHNTVIAVGSDDNKEYLIMGKGIGFGKKVTERIETRSEDTIYTLQTSTERGNNKDLAKSVSPSCLEIADVVYKEAQKVFGQVDSNMIFPLADHLEYAIKRIEEKEQMSNPLTEDIRLLFHMEYQVAQSAIPVLKEKAGVDIGEDEIGFIALHIHSAIENEKISQSMQMAQAVRTCVSKVEAETGTKIDVKSLSYNRLMNHVRYMIIRVNRGEELKVNMNEYMEITFPQSFQIAKEICEEIGNDIKCTLCKTEIGYLAMHIERVTNKEE